MEGGWEKLPSSHHRWLEWARGLSGQVARDSAFSRSFSGLHWPCSLCIGFYSCFVGQGTRALSRPDKAQSWRLSPESSRCHGFPFRDATLVSKPWGVCVHMDMCSCGLTHRCKLGSWCSPEFRQRSLVIVCVCVCVFHGIDR